MYKSLRYWGEFYSKNKTLWRVEIWQKPEEGRRWEVGRMTFPQDTPLEIEWSSVDKIEPMQPSNATLNVVSVIDRQYIDLYVVESGSVLLKVFKNYKHSLQESADAAPEDYLYWSGTLDTELYEEPFSETGDYEVSLTFSDFAILDRLNWGDSAALLSINAIILKCLEATNLCYNKAKQFTTYISTKLPPLPGDSMEPRDLDLDKLFIQTANFFDEDKQPMTMQEVLEGVLQPFALRLIQKEGSFILYDLNAVYNEYSNPENVTWASTDAKLSVDKVYNNVSVTFSPYVVTDVIAPKIKVEEEIPENMFREEAVYLNYSEDETTIGFRFYWGDVGEGVNTDFFCKFKAEHSGNDVTGILSYYRSGKKQMASVANNGYEGYMPCYPSFDMKTISFDTVYSSDAFSMSPIYLPKSMVNDPREFKVSVDLLMDARYNPFESQESANEPYYYDRVKEDCNFVYIPAKLCLKDKDGNVIYHFSNAGNVRNGWSGKLKGKWIEGDGGCNTQSTFFLAYYNSDRGHSSGVQGWQTNKQAIGITEGTLPSIYGKLGAGEYVPLPPVAGYLHFSVFPGAVVLDEKNSYTASNSLFRWFCYKDPKIQLVKINGQSVDKEDIKDIAWINKLAIEKMDIKTIVGTPSSINCPNTARGVILDEVGSIVPSFIRVGGRRNRLEHLLIGTVFSQYASRHTLLSGTVDILPHFSLYSDVNEPGEYLIISEVQDLMEDESEIKMVQLSEENYEGIEYKDYK